LDVLTLNCIKYRLDRSVYWNVTPRDLVNMHRRFRHTCCVC